VLNKDSSSWAWPAPQSTAPDLSRKDPAAEYPRPVSSNGFHLVTAINDNRRGLVPLGVPMLRNHV
jgi:hypothetical protein